MQTYLLQEEQIMIEIYETTKDTEHRFKKLLEQERLSQNFHGYSGTVVIDKNKQFQTFKGFGGALTESVGYVLSTLPEELQKSVLNSYYDEKNGLGYTFARTHMNSCDFSLGN